MAEPTQGEVGMDSVRADGLIEPDKLEAYVARFNAAEEAAGFMPSDTLARFLAVLELRTVLRSRNRLRDHRRTASRTAPGTAREPVSPREGVARRLRYSVIDRLFRHGRIERAHLMAAGEIEELYQCVNRGMFATARRMERVQESPSVRDLFDRLGDVQQRRLRESYWPWLDWLDREPVAARLRDGRIVRCAQPLPLVVDIVVDNHGLRAVERHHGLSSGAGPAILRAALHRYCLMAGYAHLPEEGFGLNGTARSRRYREQ